LRAVAAKGSDQGLIIDQALVAVDAEHVDVAPLLQAFRAHRPVRLGPYAGVDDALARLGAIVPLGIVSDGDPEIQRAKLDAVGLGTRFAVVVLSDELGREHRKPSPLPFQQALTALDVAPTAAVYVGDRPEKDVAGAAAAGMRSIRVCTGEWCDQSDDPRAWARADTAVDAVELLLGELGQGASAPTSSRKSSRPGARR
jgi:putative hydrolase of the HAD superfamily